MDVESQQTIDEAIERTAARVKELLGTGLGEVGRQLAATLSAVKSEREALQNWAEHLEVTIGPIQIPAFKITLGRTK